MGLDMWIYKRGHHVHDEVSGESYKEEDIEVGYWRKFNALHAYILDLTNSSMDSNCEEIDLNEEDIRNILDTLNQVRLILEKGTKIEKDENWYTFDEDTTYEVMELLPPRSGFFFGSTGIDNFYYEDVLDSIKIFNKVLDLVQNGEEVYYYCWW